MTQNTFDDTSSVGSDFIQHYGVKGMKWGVRRDLKKLPTKKAREAYISEKDAGWRAKTEDPKKAIRAAKRASREATRMTKQLNKKYKDMGYKLKGNSLSKKSIDNRKNRLVRNQYDIELRGIIESSLDSAAYKVYKNSPSRLYQVNLSRDLDGTVSAKIVPRQNAKLDKQRAAITNKARKIKHSDEGSQDLYVKMEEDADGFVIDIQLPEFDLELVEDETTIDHSDLSELGSDFLLHYGVKGMKWGVRKDKRGKVTSVVRRTPLRGTNEYDGPNADGKARLIKEYADPKVLTNLKSIYKDARVPINRGIKSLNKSDKYKNADLTDSKSKVFKDYHTDVSNVVKEKLNASTTLKLRENDRFVIDHYEYDSRNGSAPRLGTVTSRIGERNTNEAKSFANAVKYRHNTPVNDITDAAKSDGLNYIASASLAGFLGVPPLVGPAIVLATSTERKASIRRENSDHVNEYMKARKVRHSGLVDNDDPQDFILSFGYARNGFIEDVKMEVKPRGAKHSDVSDALIGANFVDDYIQHYGVKGMKWGKRKAEEENKPQSKSKYGTSTTNADGTTEMYVGGVGTVGRHLTEEEQAEVDELVRVVQELGDKYNSLVPEVNELEMEENKLKQTAKTPEEKKRLAEVTAKREAMSGKLDKIMDEYVPYASRYNELETKANKADVEYYKNNPQERRKANLKPKFGTTTYTIPKSKPAGPDETRFKTKVKHSDGQNGIDYSDLSDLGSDFLQHYGVKGMKWGVRKDGKPRGYQGPSSTQKKVKKAVSNVVDPDKRAKRKLEKAKSKYERQRLKEQASGYELATKESKRNSRENEEASDPRPKSKSMKDLSDDDLNKIIRRIELEKRYSTLMEEQRPKSTTEKVNKFLKKAATEAAANATKQLMTKAVGAAVTRATGVPLNGANTNAAVNALKTAANEASKDVAKAAQKQAATPPPKAPSTPTPPKAPSTPAPKVTTPTNLPKVPSVPYTPFTREPLAPIQSKNVYNMVSPTKSPSFSDILSKSYADTITSGTTQKGNSWLDEFDMSRDFVTLNEERRNRR